jgi:uncharacterized repeat protein (TIGR03803 family)
MSPAGKERVLYRFLGGSDGENPYGRLVLVSKHLYGTTHYGGGQGFQNNAGTIFALTLTGKETVLHRFTGNTLQQNYDGDNPTGALYYDGADTIYGTTVQGGSNNGGGSVFQVTL